MTDAALREMDQDFNVLYAASGRDAISPEILLQAQLLITFCMIRSKRRLVADRRQPAVALVCRFLDGRCGLGSLDLHQEW